MQKCVARNCFEPAEHDQEFVSLPRDRVSTKNRQKISEKCINRANPLRCGWHHNGPSATRFSEELLLLVRLDRAIGRRVSDAREDEALAHLVVIQEGTVRLVHGAALNDT